jgi:hypothetical protein
VRASVRASPGCEGAPSPSRLTAVAASSHKCPDERKEALARAVQTEIANGARVESQGDYQAVTVRGHRPNHILHLILTIITGGVWGLLVWLPIAIFGGEKRRMVTVDEFGKHRRAEGVTTPPLKRAAGPDLV